jgi:hypothetical protein
VSDTAGLVIGLLFIVIGAVLFDDLIPSLAAMAGGVLLIAGTALHLRADS